MAVNRSVKLCCVPLARRIFVR